MREISEPGTWCLFKTVEGFVQFAHIVGKGRIHKPLGLFHVDIFSKYPMEKGVGNVQLDGSQFNDKAEGVMVVNPTNLIKSFGH